MTFGNGLTDQTNQRCGTASTFFGRLCLVFSEAYYLIIHIFFRCYCNVREKKCSSDILSANQECRLLRPLSRLRAVSLFLQIKGLFTWSGGPRSSGVGFFCFHALGDTKQKKLTPLDRGPPPQVNRVLVRAMHRA